MKGKKDKKADPFMVGAREGRVSEGLERNKKRIEDSS